ncbi:MAG: MoxR family ATPase [Gammaproteobacteria bacterium]|nr:MoxR family ATPase [Gammaproteobacteria bacterium]
MQQNIDKVKQAINAVILGKAEQVDMAVACLLAKGHLLIEDLPGMGKTTLAHALAATFGLEFQRVQFTSDLLPADITGSSIYERKSETFVFHSGPIFSQVVLADEINRATPKTQSALLEAMEEHQVTIEGTTHKLPEPFFVIATQNPSSQVGTYPLPESQLDRFLIRLSLGYPDPKTEAQLLLNGGRRKQTKIPEAISSDELNQMQHAVSQITASEALVDYVMSLILETRQSTELNHGLSPRAGLAIIEAAKAVAFMRGGDFVVPEDVQKVFPFVVGHRLQTSTRSDLTGQDVAEVVIQKVSVPV